MYDQRAETLYFAVGHRLPSISAVLADLQDGYTQIDLSDCTVKFSMRSISTGEMAVTDAEAVVEQIDGDSSTNGRVRYDWTEEDVANAGRFHYWWTVTRGSDGLTERFPVGNKRIVEFQ